MQFLNTPLTRSWKRWTMNDDDAMTDLNSSNHRPVRAIDLFCGIGGNSWGAKEAGVQIIAGFDCWDLAGAVYRDNFPEARFYSDRLQDIKVKSVTKQLGNIDLILASPECTSHSVARGNRKRYKRSMNLAFQVTRFSEILRPRWIVVENVIHMRNWELYNDFIATLKDQGYKVREQELVASDFGVPQSRKRLYLLCDREQMPPGIVPPADVGQKRARDVINLDGVYPMTPLDNGRRAAKTLIRAKRGIEALGRKVPFLLVYYGSDGNGKNGWQSLDRPLRTVTTVNKFALVKPGEDGDSHVMRMLQLEELRAAMGFPDTFILDHGNRSERIRMLGNAVCPPVMKAIVKTLINSPIKGYNEK